MSRTTSSTRGQLIGFTVGFALIAAMVGGALWYMSSQNQEDEPVFEEEDLNLDFLEE